MLQLVVDTNLFHEFRPLEELPWQELGEIDEIILIVTDVVQTELDEHKKSTRARLKRTAIKITKQFREMLLTDQDETVIQEDAPRVILRLDDTGYGDNTFGKLDFSVFDDQLVGIAKVIAEQASDGSVFLFSNDIRPLRKAKSVGIPIKEIPEEWRRAEERTDADIERDRLIEENKRLKSQEPILTLTADVSNPHRIVLSDYSALATDQVERLLAMLLSAHPKEVDFARNREIPPSSMGLGRGITQSEFRPANPSAIEQYEDTDYPNWVSACRELLESAHHRLSLASHKFDVSISLNNTGTRPADDLLFTVRSMGALGVMPPPYLNDDDELDDASSDLLIFPRAPKAPQGYWQVISSTSQLVRGMMLADTSRTDHLASIASLQRSIIQSPQSRNPNDFYYVERPDDYVSHYELTCAQFRHTGKLKLFDCKCWVDGIAAELDGKNAVIEIKAEAANLTDQVIHKIGIQFSTEPKSAYDEVLELIERFNLGF